MERRSRKSPTLATRRALPTCVPSSRCRRICSTLRRVGSSESFLLSRYRRSRAGCPRRRSFRLRRDVRRVSRLRRRLRCAGSVRRPRGDSRLAFVEHGRLGLPRAPGAHGAGKAASLRRREPPPRGSPRGNSRARVHGRYGDRRPRSSRRRGRVARRRGQNRDRLRSQNDLGRRAVSRDPERRQEPAHRREPLRLAPRRETTDARAICSITRKATRFLRPREHESFLRRIPARERDRAGRDLRRSQRRRRAAWSGSLDSLR